MSSSDQHFALEVVGTDKRCPSGEKTGNENIAERRIPVLSCEGACIRGEIARLAAHMVAKEEGFARACHGELLSVPDSAMAKWVMKAEKVVLIDGCFLRCHGRIVEGLVAEENLRQFDALTVYKKYTEFFEIDAVPEDDRRAAARQVANTVLAAMAKEQ